MNIVVAFKVVPDDQDIQVAGDRTLDFSKAKPTVSTYDLNAIEAAAKLASQVEGSKVTAVTVGAADIDDSKLKKNVLARGVDELYMTADDSYKAMDAHATAAALSNLLAGIDGYDLILCGDGSADNYAQQVDVQLASKLGIPVVNAATEIVPGDGAVQVRRTLEDVVEVVEVPLPAVVSVSPDIALPRIPGMKDILAAGKKPMNGVAAGKIPAGALETVSCLAPEQADRMQVVLEASADGAIDQFVTALKAAR